MCQGATSRKRRVNFIADHIKHTKTTRLFEGNWEIGQTQCGNLQDTKADWMERFCCSMFNQQSVFNQSISDTLSTYGASLCQRLYKGRNPNVVPQGVRGCRCACSVSRKFCTKVASKFALDASRLCRLTQHLNSGCSSGAVLPSCSHLMSFGHAKVVLVISSYILLSATHSPLLKLPLVRTHETCNCISLGREREMGHPGKPTCRTWAKLVLDLGSLASTFR